MKVLHVAVSMNPSSGFIQQMEYEQEAANDLGFDWVSLVITPNRDKVSKIILSPAINTSSSIVKYIKLRHYFYRWLKEHSSRYDIILLRYSVHDPMQAYFLRKHSHVVTVHHTLELDELQGCAGFWGIIKYQMEKCLGKHNLQHVAGVVAVTKEILDHELSRCGVGRMDLPGFVYPNGVISNQPVLIDNRSEVPELIMVANYFSGWHGLDLLIDAMDRDDTPCILHLVGSVPDELMERCGQDPRVRIHGYLDRSQIHELMTRAWCGISSLALFRKNMRNACSLKVREYLAAGIPVYADHDDEGLPSVFPFFRKGPAILSEILEFACKNRHITKEMVRNNGIKYIDKKELLSVLHGELYSAVCCGEKI